MLAIQNEIGIRLDSIVVATDFGAESEKALAYARALALRFASRITLAHVIDLSVATPAEPGLLGFPLNQMRHSSADNMERVLNELGQEGITAQGKTIESVHPASAVVDIARAVQADLIVVGTHSRRGLSRLIMGSCSGDIVHSATCPVIVIGPQVDLNSIDLAFRSIVLATDLKHDSVEKAAVALTFAKNHIDHIHIVHVIEDPLKPVADAFEEQAHAELALAKLIPDSSWTWCTPKYSVVFGNVDQQIMQIAKKTQADLIVLGAHRGIKWFDHLWQGHVVEKVVAQATCPVLTVCTNE